MKKLQEKGKEKDFADYVVGEKLLEKIKIELKDLRGQHSTLKLQMNLDQDRRVKEEGAFHAKLRQEEAIQKQLTDAKLNTVIKKENTLRLEEENSLKRTKDLDLRELNFTKRKEELEKLGLLGIEGEKIVKQKQDFIQEKADLQKLDIGIGEKASNNRKKEKELASDRIGVEKLRLEIEDTKKRADIKMVEADGKLSSITSIHTDNKNLVKKNEGILQQMKIEKEAIAEKEKSNKAVLENIEKSRQELDPQFEKLIKSEKETKAMLKEARDKNNNAERVNQENQAMLEVLENRKKQLEAQDREVKARLGVVQRREIQAGIK